MEIAEIQRICYLNIVLQRLLEGWDSDLLENSLFQINSASFCLLTTSELSKHYTVSFLLSPFNCRRIFKKCARLLQIKICDICLYSPYVCWNERMVLTCHFSYEMVSSEINQGLIGRNQYFRKLDILRTYDVFEFKQRTQTINTNYHSSN